MSEAEEIRSVVLYLIAGLEDTRKRELSDAEIICLVKNLTRAYVAISTPPEESRH